MVCVIVVTAIQHPNGVHLFDLAGERCRVINLLGLRDRSKQKHHKSMKILAVMLFLLCVSVCTYSQDCIAIRISATVELLVWAQVISAE